VLGLNWWINDKVYNRDKQALREELIKIVEDKSNLLVKDHNAAMKKQFNGLKDGLLSDHKERLKEFLLEISKDQVEGFTYTLRQVADIRLFLRDVEGAVRAGLEQCDNATRSNTNGSIRSF